MKARPLFLPLLIACAFSGSAALAQQSGSKFKIVATFDYPGATSTLPTGINDAGEIVGSFIDASGATRGFVRYADGTFSAPIIEPNDDGNLTFASDIANNGVICGIYKSGLYTHSYFLAGGTYSEFNVAGSLFTNARGLNEAGDFVGNYIVGGGPSHPFADIGGTVQTIAIPNPNLGGSAAGINDADEIVGNYLDTSFLSHGFFQDSFGTVTFPVDFPGAQATSPRGLNDKHLAVGSFLDERGYDHGFLLKFPNSFLKFDYPGAVSTILSAVNNRGLICGQYQGLTDGGYHGVVVQAKRKSAP